MCSVGSALASGGDIVGAFNLFTLGLSLRDYNGTAAKGVPLGPRRGVTSWTVAGIFF